jgi:hypothetical protein
VRGSLTCATLLSAAPTRGAAQSERQIIMATKTFQVDDIDGTSEATHKISITLDGATYALDLNDKNFAQAQADLAQWTAAGAVAQTKRTSNGGGVGGEAITLDGKNVTKAQVRNWVATKSEDWANDGKFMQYLRVDEDGVLRLAGPHYVPPVLMKALRDEVLAQRSAKVEAASEARPVPAQPKPAARPAPAKRSQAKVGAK